MMSRAVTAGHIMFNECIDAFRPNPRVHTSSINEPSKSILLAAFEIEETWDLGVCTIHPSTRVNLSGGKTAFISTVDNPNWVEKYHPQFFGIALSAIISFATQKVFKSTGDDYFYRQPELKPPYFKQVALYNPVIFAGIGAQASLTAERKILIFKEVKHIIELLHKIDYKKYRAIMQSIRMIHLALINKKEDFGLAYSLIIAAIESIAQTAIKRDKVKQKHPSEKIWQEKAKNDEDFNELFRAYKESQGKNQYLKERYIQFILDYAPVCNWEEYVSHPYQEHAERLEKVVPNFNKYDHIQKHWSDIYPTQLKPSDLRKILSDSYAYRSSFVHTGEQPPHRNPNSFLNRFFEDKLDYDGVNLTRKILPNFELMYGLAKHGLLNWLDKEIKP